MEALWWQPGKDGSVTCFLCPHNCRIQPGGRGRCTVRENQDGALHARNYGELGGIALDPVEKKPLYHFRPGSMILSLGSIGCNLDCGFCQNHEAVSGAWPTKTVTPAEVIELAKQTRDRGNVGLAWTYTEPLMWYEFVLESARLAQKQGLKTVLVTNGFINPQPWQQLLAHVDAVNIDIKSFRPEFYQEHCGGRLAPVLQTVKEAVGHCHVEVTTLLVPDENTDPDEIDALSEFLAALDPEIPLHLSRYYPARNWHRPPTSVDTVHTLAERARKRLRYVYAGNIPGRTEATHCPQCDKAVVTRDGNIALYLKDNSCPRCGHRISIHL